MDSGGFRWIRIHVGITNDAPARVLALSGGGLGATASTPYNFKRGNGRGMGRGGHPNPMLAAGTGLLEF